MVNGCTLFFALISTSFPALAGGAAPSEHRKLLDAIRQVESGGDDRAVGDGGRSLGGFQIQRACWHDATRHGGVNWDYSRGVWDRQKCEQVFLWYTSMYGARTDEQRARIWNGGPSGMKKKATAAYWHRVQEAMR